MSSPSHPPLTRPLLIHVRFVRCERRDKWGHPRIWATVTGWPPICQEVRDNFTQEEVVQIHTKRFLEFQDLKRQHSARLKRPIILHCCILAFEPSTVINLGNAKWVNAAMQYLGEVLPSKKGTKKAERESYTTDQWFFPMSLNTPAVRPPPFLTLYAKVADKATADRRS